MKIAYISTTYFADVDFCYLKEASRLNDVSYILLYNKNGNATVCNFEIFYPHTGLFHSDIYPELQKYENFIDLKKTFVLNINSNRSISFSFFYAYFLLLLFLIKNKFDLIHVTKAFDFPAYLLYALRKKILISVHDPIDHSSTTSRRVLFNKKVSMKLLDKFIIFNSKQEIDFIEKYELDMKKIKLLVSRLGCYNCLRIHMGSSINKDNYKVLFFGTINSYKGLEYLFPAAVKAHNQEARLKFIIAGKGHYNFDIEEYKNLDYIDIANRFISDYELSSFIQECSVVVLPYVDATQSGVVMSSFAFNKPCIVTKVGGLPEMVENGVHGIVVPPCDSEALSKAIVSLVNDECLMELFESNIKRDYGSGRYSWTAISEELNSFYKLCTNS